MMDTLPKRTTHRLQQVDYSMNGAYFITICTHYRRRLLSHIVGALHEAPLRSRPLLSQIVGYLKMNVTKAVRRWDPSEIVWQRSFYDHIIRNDQDYQEIWQYIDNNSRKWLLGKYS